jgi:hypothetical protein
MTDDDHEKWRTRERIRLRGKRLREKRAVVTKSVHLKTRKRKLGRHHLQGMMILKRSSLFAKDDDEFSIITITRMEEKESLQKNNHFEREPGSISKLCLDNSITS